MRLGFTWVVAVVGILLLTGFALSVASSPNASVAGGPIVPRSSGSSQKVHLIEGVTGTWCQWCGPMDPALARYVEEHDDVAFVAYHGPNVANDPFADPSVIGVRAGFYTIYGYPTTIIDGGGATLGDNNPLYMIGSQNNPPPGPGPEDSPSNYDWIASNIQSFTDTSSNIAISIDGDLTAGTATASVTIVATDPVPQPNLYVRIVLYEDALYYSQVSGPPFHPNVARALNEQSLTIMQGQTVTKSTTFTLNPAWNKNNLGVVAFVQSNTKRSFATPYGPAYASDVLNAATFEFTPSSILVHSAAGTAADYGEKYEVVLAQGGERFETWNTYEVGDTGAVDSRGLPPASVLSEAPALILATGARTQPVLTAADRSLIDAHLAGSGDLLITGSGIGFDGWINYRPWFQANLHATYESDDTGIGTVQGVAGNPISNGFVGTTLSVLSSGDRIAAYGPGAETPFRYTPGALPGSVNAQHDPDSRIVYLGFQYFENTADANRRQVLSAILDWLDGGAPPHVQVFTPGMCQVVAPGSTFPIRWEATDVRVPANGIDIYWSQDGGVNWMPIATGEPNDGRYNWNVPGTVTSNARVKVVVRDSMGNSAQVANLGSFIISSSTTGVTCSLPFSSGDVGWRLVSFPLIPTNPNAPAILNTLGGSYEAARSYSAVDADDHWKAFVPAKGGGDMVRLDQTMSFWVKITGAGTLSVVGDVPTTPQMITLFSGWSLVGFPSYHYGYTVADLKADTGATEVEGFDPMASPYYLRALPDDYILMTGEGYWVYVPATITWTVPL